MRCGKIKIKKFTNTILSLALITGLAFGGRLESKATSPGEPLATLELINYSGDDPVTKSIKVSDENLGGNPIKYVNLVDYNTEWTEDLRKTSLSLTDSAGTLTLEENPPGQGALSTKTYDLKFSLTGDFQKLPLDTNGGDQKLEETKYILAMDTKGNKTWQPLYISAMNQNAKGQPKPSRITKYQFDTVSKDDIVKAFADGHYDYKEEVPSSNRNLEKKVNGNQYYLDMDRFKLDIDEEALAKFDTSKVGLSKFPVKVKYLKDNSYDEVEVIIDIKSAVPTGILGRGYGISLMIVGLGALFGGLSLYRLKKKAHIDYD